jgi:hypothetical protein
MSTCIVFGATPIAQRTANAMRCTRTPVSLAGNQATISLRCPPLAIRLWKTERRRKGTRMNVGDRVIRRGLMTVSPQSQEMDTKRLDPQLAFLRPSMLSPSHNGYGGVIRALPLGTSTQDQGREVI